MELSNEDSLRLNVLIANAVAVRIDEGAMIVYGLSKSGDEARVQLSPNCNPDRYVRNVRELFSSVVLGSPRGYPVYLKRWSRMGQASDMRLSDLLMLGEPEAVVAVSGSPTLTDELARRTWWTMPDSDNARRMLKSRSVVEGEMGKVLAEFLLEFLPFEQEPQQIIESVQLVLQPGLIDEEARLSIWQRGRQKNVFMVGFLLAVPHDLPEQKSARHDYEQVQVLLDPLVEAGNPFAQQLSRIFSETGQTFLHACSVVLRKPSNQDVVVGLMEALELYFKQVRISPFHYHDVAAIRSAVGAMLNNELVDNVLAGDEGGSEGSDEESEMKLPAALHELLEAAPGLSNEIEAMLLLAHTGEPIVCKIFAQTDSVGTVMRKKLQSVSTPLMEAISLLQAD
jgi:hypothetical protein